MENGLREGDRRGASVRGRLSLQVRNVEALGEARAMPVKRTEWIYEM